MILGRVGCLRSEVGNTKPLRGNGAAKGQFRKRDGLTQYLENLFVFASVAYWYEPSCGPN